LVCLHAFGQFEGPENAMRRGDTALGQGRFDVAQSIYQNVLSSNPDLKISSWRCRNIAESNIRATHPNLEMGAEWLRRGVEQDPQDLSLRERLGTVLLQIGEFNRAAAQYTFLNATQPGNPRYVLGLATALRNSGKYDQGADLLLAALNRRPNDPDLRVEYARTLLYQGKYGEAAVQYQLVLRWYPKDIDALIGFGKTYSWGGSQQQALEQFQRALVVDPDNYDALVGQGFSLIWSSRENEALPMLERANSRHPEAVPVRDALKRLHAINIFNGDVSAGGPVWPILPPSLSIWHISDKGRSTTIWNAPPPQVRAFPEVSPGNQPAPAPLLTRPGQFRSNRLWSFGVGLAVLLAILVLAAFILFSKPAPRRKPESANAASRLAENHSEHNLGLQWARLQEFSRNPAEPREAAPPRRTQIAPAATAWQSMRMGQSEAASTAASGSQQVEPAFRENDPWRDSDVAAHRPRRRRRGAAGPPERPWWRDFSYSDPAQSARHDEPDFAPPSSGEADFALPSSEDSPLPKVPFMNPAEEVEALAASPKPSAAPPTKPSPPEAPPFRRSFVEVLSRAMERFSDGQGQESPEPVLPEIAEEEELAPNAPSAPISDSSAQEPVVSQELANVSIVIAGSGVMVAHYRAILKASGADVRTFTFWDLALTSMRKRRADVLLIDGDALDGLTPTRMYDSAQLERSMFGSALVAVNSDEDRITLPQNVVFAHSLTDEDVRRRIVESLQA
jgi:tetratricopeptide (TPR) repeat protein